jgi:hypothetical protein
MGFEHILVERSGDFGHRDLGRRLPGTPLTQPNGCHMMATVRLLCVGGCHGFS